MRSLLFIPGDSEKKLAKAPGCGADVVILDLEDAVAPAHKEKAREMVADYLKSHQTGKSRIYVRVNALSTGLTDADLDAVIGEKPDGIMLPKCEGGVDAIALGAKLAAREASHDHLAENLQSRGSVALRGVVVHQLFGDRDRLVEAVGRLQRADQDVAAAPAGPLVAERAGQRLVRLNPGDAGIRVW